MDGGGCVVWGAGWSVRSSLSIAAISDRSATFFQVPCPPPFDSLRGLCPGAVPASLNGLCPGRTLSTDFLQVGLCPSLCNNGFLEHRRLVHRPAALAACAALAALAADGVNVLDLQYMSLPSIACSAEQFRTLQTVLLGRVASRQMRAVLLLCSLSNSTRYK